MPTYWSVLRVLREVLLVLLTSLALTQALYLISRPNDAAVLAGVILAVAAPGFWFVRLFRYLWRLMS
jgi:hypothetical protein